MERTLSRRERQIIDVLYRQGKATAAEVREAIADAPSYSAVRATLRILEEKGVVKHEEAGGRYVFVPVRSRDAARRSALRGLLDTFFEGSAAQAAAALLGSPAARFTPEELDRLEALIRKAKGEKS